MQAPSHWKAAALSLISRSKATSLVVVVGLVALFVAAFDLCMGRAVVPWDAHDFFAPYFLGLADFARAGELMLWNPWLVGGIPDYAEPQIGTFSPLMLLVGFVFGGSLLGFRIYFLTIWWLSGLGIFLLGRRFRAPAWGAGLVAFNWIFSGFLLGHAEHVSWIYSLAWLPFEVLLLDKAIEEGSWRKFAAAGALWGVSLLGGYPGVVFNNVFVFAAWALGRCLFPVPDSSWASHSTAGRAARVAAGLAIALAVACAVMAPNLAGILVEGVGVTERSGALPRSAALGNNPLGPLCLLTFASPFLATLPAAAVWPHTDLSSVSVYIGAPTLLLAVISLFHGRRVIRWCVFAGSVILFLVALGPALPLRGWLYDYFFFTRYFQHPAIFRGPAMCLLAILALLGIRDLDRDEARRWLPLLVSLVLAGTSLLVFPKVAGLAKVNPTPLAQGHLALVWLGSVLAFLLYAVLPVARGRLRKTLWAGSLVSIAFLDGYLCNKISVTSSDHRPGIVASEHQLENRHRASLDIAQLTGFSRTEHIQGGLGVPALSAWPVVLKTPVLSGYTCLRNVRQERMAKVPSTRALAVGNTKVWFSPSAVQAPPTGTLFDAFLDRSEAAKIPPLTIHEPDDFQKNRPPHASDLAAMQVATSVSPLDARLLAYTPRHLDFQVDAPSDGWLLVTDRWAPGWRATVNDRPTVVHPADFIFRAVAVKAGSNKVAFRYRPVALPITLALCWGTLGVVGLLQVRRRGSRAARPVIR
jgi:hypothetical protein